MRAGLPISAPISLLGGFSQSVLCYGAKQGVLLPFAGMGIGCLRLWPIVALPGLNR